MVDNLEHEEVYVPQARTVLEVRNLKMHFPIRRGFFNRVVGEVKAVDDVSFTVRERETLGLVGESGCGKTTLGRCIARAYKPTDGQILYYEDIDFTEHLGKLRVHIRNYKKTDSATDRDVIDLAKLEYDDLKPYRHDVRMIFQDPYSSLNPRMTVFDIVADPLRVHNIMKGKELEDHVASLLARVGLRPEYMRRYPHAFSGGQRQRIGIARALSLSPRIVIADEAVSALDVSVRAQILNLLLDLQKDFKLTFLFISHDLSVVEYVADRVAVMYVGKLVEVAKTEQLFAMPKHPYTEALLSAVPKPDPRQRSDRIVLIGDVPDPANPPTGCYFHPRCRYAQKRCVDEAPPLRDIGDDHLVACHFAEELSLRGVRMPEMAVSDGDIQDFR
jgi:peptide/nickel transport system ATP-binding protein